MGVFGGDDAKVGILRKVDLTNTNDDVCDHGLILGVNKWGA